MKHARITELAESDLAKIWLYIARDNPDAADQFIDKLRVQCQRLASVPQQGRPDPNSRWTCAAIGSATASSFTSRPTTALKWPACSMVPATCPVSSSPVRINLLRVANPRSGKETFHRFRAR